MRLQNDLLIAAALADRTAFEAGGYVLGDASLTETAQRAWDCIAKMYAEDQNAACVDPVLLSARLRAEASTDKLGDVYEEFVRDLPPNSSSIHVREICRAIRTNRMGLSIVDLLLAQKHAEALAPMMEFQEFVTSTGDSEQHETQLDLQALLKSRANKVPMMPKKMGEVLNGGLSPGNTMLIFGRPGSGKTLVCVNVAAGYAFRGLTVLYIGNEESQQMLSYRFLSLMGGQKLMDLDSPDSDRASKAISSGVELANTRGWNNVHIIHGLTSYVQIMREVDRIQPAVVVLDQLRNVKDAGGYGDAMHSDMEAVTRQYRLHANRKKFIGLMVGQAGASGENKMVLDLNDFDGSKTGVQGAVDVMAGVGVTAELRREGKRVISYCRNKVSGIIADQLVHVEEQYTRIASK